MIILKKQITKEELEKLYNTKTIKEICDFFCITSPTLYAYLKKSDIKLKGAGRKKLEVINS